MAEADQIEQIRDLVRKNDPSALDLIYDVFGTRLYRYVLVLPLEQREVVAMKCWQDMTFDEIAVALKVSPNTVASRYRYALTKLRGHLMHGN